VRQPASAEEVTQDVFLKVWQQPHRWNPSLGRFSSWLLTTTRNAAIDRLRVERRRSTADLSEYEGDEALAEPSHFDDPIWADGQELRRLLALLPADQRELVELAFFSGYTHSELATVTGLPLGTVKTRLRTALHRLREMMEGADSS
jgi:RNA polymerase sigma-70 factor (ECF subfamily)